MKIINKLNIVLILFSLGTLSLMNSCIDEKLFKPEEILNPTFEDGYYLQFRLNLASMGETRFAKESNAFKGEIDESYEDYINPDNISVLFFTNDEGNDAKLIRKFSTSGEKPDKLDFIPIDPSGNRISKEWYLRIPITTELEEEGFPDKLRENPFKIAVTANWPIGTPDISPGDKIRKLHHQVTPNQTDKFDSDKDNYGFLYEGYDNLGAFSNWVKAGFTTDEADNYIRTQYGPGIMADNSQFSHGELWLLWNFTGAMAANETEGIKYYSGNTFASQWFRINNDHLYSWLTNSTATTKLENIGPITNNTGNFQFIGGENNDFQKSKVAEQTVNIDGTYTTLKGIHLASGSKDKNVIRLTMPNNGKLTIKWGSTDEQEATLEMQVRNHPNDENPKTNSESKATNTAKTTEKYTTFSTDKDEIKITGDAEYLFIYSPTGNAIIYEIEYISSYYLHNIDNRGVLPQELNIPMYGIQEFPALRGYWAKGTTFDLYNYNNLEELSDNFKKIYLLRSVAKVELKIPRSLNPQHVYLRSQNRKARCEPVDVYSPTETIWEKSLPTYTDHADICEDWKNIMKHPPFYNSNAQTSDKDGQWNRYRSKLAWYFGNWAVDGKVGPVNGGVNERVTPDPTTNYPHVMNAMIERTDFTEFFESGSTNQYYRYILYVPDKYIDDLSTVKKTSNTELSTPKVCHIEFRNSDDPYTNIDDNNCYRIYFTEGGFAGTKYPTFEKIGDSGDIDDNWEYSYEQNNDILQKHWPIIRNHIYSFTVSDIHQRMVVVKLEVLPWAMVEGNQYNW